MSPPRKLIGNGQQTARTAIRTHVGHAIARYRIARRLNQTALGMRLGVTQMSVSRWESGRQKLSVEDLVLIARELRVPVTALLPSEAQLRQVPA